MGINITVGFFVDISELEYLESKELFDHYRAQFASINRFLSSLALPEHQEPETLGGAPALNLTATRELYPLRWFAEEVETRTELRFPHLLSVAHSNGGIFLPLEFDQVLLPAADFGIESSLGSAYRLHCECLKLAQLLGIEADFENPIIACPKLDLSTIAYSRKDYALDYQPEHIWPEGAGSCYNLYSASHFSITHKAAIVIY